MTGTIAIVLWIPVVFWLMANRHPATAVSAAIIGGYLLLPANFALDLPAIPTLDKNSIPAIATILAVMMMIGPAHLRALPPGMILPGWVPRSRVIRILALMILVGKLGTVLTNGDMLFYGPQVLPSLRLYDAASQIGGVLFMLFPFLLARKYLAHPAAQETLLVALAIAGLCYSLPALFEVRMSPQLSNMIYGYFPHDWQQHIRAGGYRPVVFLPHGLWLAIFFCCAFLACLALWRISAGKPRGTWMLATLWMLVTLVLAKGIGALGIGLMLGVAVMLLPVRSWMLLAAALAIIILLYPMMRGAGLIPTDSAVNLAADIDQERAGSLHYRFINEDILLEKANQRPLFGWGGWGRNRVFDETGQDISTTDGYWIISIGTSGWIGYIGMMGLLTLPLILLAVRWRVLMPTAATAGIAIALAANLIDLIPNAGLSPVTWLMAGALAGRLELGRLPETAAAGPEDAASPLPHRRSAYSRQGRRHPAFGPLPAARTEAHMEAHVAR